MKFERIICAVDFSPGASEAFQAAVELARVYSGALLLFHVTETPPAVPGEVMIEIVNKANDAMQGLLASARASLHGLIFTAEVTSGLASVEIVNRAREWQADLIVLGSKGTTSLEEIILGGTAEAVAKEAPCSVLVARAEVRFNARADKQVAAEPATKFPP
jgi:nucleotide-binding universal stress UspA family protein